jgi:hypothetical protein
VNRRTTVTLTDRDEEILGAFADKQGHEWAELQVFAAEHGFDLTESSSEATIMRVLMAAGRQFVLERILERGYADMARIYGELVPPAEQEAMLRRRATRGDDSEVPA